MTRNADPRRAESLTSDAKRAMYQGLLDFVQTEFVEGTCEGGQACEC
jgi:hypothetical protein